MAATNHAFHQHNIKSMKTTTVIELKEKFYEAKDRLYDLVDDGASARKIARQHRCMYIASKKM